MSGVPEPCQLAGRIAFLFQDFEIERGSYKCSYWHPDQGYRMNCLVADPSEAERLFNTVLQIQSHQLDYDRFSVNRLPYKSFNSDPDNGRRERPTGNVQFLFAELKVHEQPDLILVDYSRRRKDILSDGTCS
jgi:hypothetical protein